MSVNDIRYPKAKELFKEVAGASECSSTFIFGNEDHTLGNTLRHIVMQQPETEFCGYSVPHPYEPKVNVRIQCRGKPAKTVLVKSLVDMKDMCGILEQKFISSVEKFSH